MRSLRAGEGIQVMAESGGSLSLDALRRRVDETLDACTRCGKCVAACPMVEPAGIDLGNDAVNAPAIVGGILDLLAGGEGTPDAARWAQVCTNSGKCIPACDYGANPRFMVNMARVAVKAKLGDGEVRRAAHHYFNTMSRGTRVISRLQLAPEVVARLNPPLREKAGTVTPPYHTDDANCHSLGECNRLRLIPFASYGIDETRLRWSGAGRKEYQRPTSMLSRGRAPGVRRFSNEVWLRPDLAPRDRCLVTVSALIASGQVAQLPVHLNKAMDNGPPSTQTLRSRRFRPAADDAGGLCAHARAADHGALRRAEPVQYVRHPGPCSRK
jgi:ferredoxin